MVRVAVCDDDSFYLENEKKLIESYLNSKKVKHEIVDFKSSIELTKAYANNFDIIFLDISMEHINGIEVAKLLRDKGAKSHIVFVTAYAEYLPEGYKVDAHRYLLKNDTNFEESFKECMDSLINKIQVEDTKIEFDVQGGLLSVAPTKIIYAESKAHRVTVYVLEHAGDLKEYYMYDKLDNIQEKLEKFGFIRIHQSYLINRIYLRNVCRYRAELSKGVSLPISKKYYNEVEEYYIRVRGEL